jgi:hypothetical protein
MWEGKHLFDSLTLSLKTALMAWNLNVPWRLQFAQLLFSLYLFFFNPAALASNHAPAPARSSEHSQAHVYPEFQYAGKTVHWLKDQMPLKVYVSPGTTLDKIIDEETGGPVCNVNNLGAWPDLAAKVLETPGQLQAQPMAEGFYQEYYQAAKDGIDSWNRFSREGFISFQFTADPQDADIYVFWVHHFVNKLGMELLANDIRGYTSKISFPLDAILAGKKVPFKPVVIMLRTTNSNHNSVPLPWMKASSAHEFGHALGIEGHSTNQRDLMSVYYGNGTISDNDAATLRYVYQRTPDLVP